MQLETPRCCAHHVAPFQGVGWCANARFDGCEPCCAACPDWQSWEDFDAEGDEDD